MTELDLIARINVARENLAVLRQHHEEFGKILARQAAELERLAVEVADLKRVVARKEKPPDA